MKRLRRDESPSQDHITAAESGAGALLSAALSRRSLHLGSSTAALSAATHIPALLEPPSDLANENALAGSPQRPASSFCCRSCAAAKICAACAEECHSGHVVELALRASLEEGCDCSAGAHCFNLPPGRGVDGSSRGFLTGLMQCLFVLGMPFVHAPARCERLLSEGADVDGCVLLHRLVRGLRGAGEATRDGAAALPPLPHLAGIAALLALSPFWRLSKIGSQSRVSIAPRHPRADLVLAAAAAHVHGALTADPRAPRAVLGGGAPHRPRTLSEAASWLQSRFLGTLALDRVVEPAALLWAAVLLERPPSGVDIFRSLPRFCAEIYANLGRAQSNVPGSVASTGEWCQWAFDVMSPTPTAAARGPTGVQTGAPDSGPGRKDGELTARAEKTVPTAGTAMQVPLRQWVAVAPARGLLTSGGAVAEFSRRQQQQTAWGFDGGFAVPGIAQGYGNAGSPASDELRPATAMMGAASVGDTAVCTGVPATRGDADSGSSPAAIVQSTSRTVGRGVEDELENYEAPPAAVAGRWPGAGEAECTGTAGSASGGGGPATAAAAQAGAARARADAPAAQPQAASALSAQLLLRVSDSAESRPGPGADSAPGRRRRDSVSDSADSELAVSPSLPDSEAARARLCQCRLPTPGPAASPLRPLAMAVPVTTSTTVRSLDELEAWTAEHLYGPLRPGAIALRVYAASAPEVDPGHAGAFYHVPRKIVHHIALACAGGGSSAAPATTTVVIDVAAMLEQRLPHQPDAVELELRRGRIGQLLGPVLLDPAVLKVLHAGSEAVAWLQSSLGLFLCHVLDTHVALDEAAAREDLLAASPQPARLAPPPQGAAANLLAVKVSVADLRRLEYSACLAVDTVAPAAAAAGARDGPAAPSALTDAVRRLCDLPSALRLAGLAQPGGAAAQAAAAMAAEAEGLLALASLTAAAHGIDDPHLARRVAVAPAEEQDPALPPPLAAYGTRLRAGRAGANERAGATWPSVMLRSELESLRAPPFDDYHGATRSAEGAGGGDGPLLSAVPLWYARCPSCGRGGHRTEACPGGGHS